ncbi:PIN domain-containing protein, partial [Treponema sp. R80B11-R83G3]
MKVLIDTNVVLDVVLKNALFEDSSRAILDKAEQLKFTGYISASAVTDIFYLSQKKLGKKIAKEVIKELLHIFYPATVTDGNIYEALDLDWSDFEDSVQYVVGISFSADYIVTRNAKDYASG